MGNYVFFFFHLQSSKIKITKKTRFCSALIVCCNTLSGHWKIIVARYETARRQSQWPALSSPRPLWSQQSVNLHLHNEKWSEGVTFFLAASANSRSSFSSWAIFSGGRAGQSCHCRTASMEVVRRLLSIHWYSFKYYDQRTFTFYMLHKFQEILFFFMRSLCSLTLFS